MPRCLRWFTSWPSSTESFHHDVVERVYGSWILLCIPVVGLAHGWRMSLVPGHSRIDIDFVHSCQTDSPSRKELNAFAGGLLEHPAHLAYNDWGIKTPTRACSIPQCSRGTVQGRSEGFISTFSGCPCIVSPVSETAIFGLIIASLVV